MAKAGSKKSAPVQDFPVVVEDEASKAAWDRYQNERLPIKGKIANLQYLRNSVIWILGDLDYVTEMEMHLLVGYALAAHKEIVGKPYEG